MFAMRKDSDFAVETEEQEGAETELAPEIKSFDEKSAEQEKSVEKFVPSISYSDWAEKTINKFLDISDIANQTEKRNAIIALKMDEESVSARLDLCEGALALDSEYAKAVGDTEGLEYVAKYRAKIKSLKAFMGM